MAEFQTDIFGGQIEVRPVEELEEPVLLAATRSDFNIFSLTDAIGARNKKLAWTLYHQALFMNLAAEEVFWKVVWIVKSMMLAAQTHDYSETDMKEFPYKKAKGYAKNFKEGELEELSEALVIGYHMARRGKGEIETLLEKLILNL